MNKYWLEEQPKAIETDKNTIRYYEKAGKLQVSLPDWQDGKGKLNRGKTITLDLEALQLSKDVEKAANIFEEIAGLL